MHKLHLPLPFNATLPALFDWAIKLIQILNSTEEDALADPGTIKVWPDTIAPYGWFVLSGQVLIRTEHLELFRLLGTRFNTGGEAATEFRLPSPANPFTGGRWIIKH